jgi:hypothetical protein
LKAKAGAETNSFSSTTLPQDNEESKQEPNRRALYEECHYVIRKVMELAGRQKHNV